VATVPSLSLHAGAETIFGQPGIVGLELAHAVFEDGRRDDSSAGGSEGQYRRLDHRGLEGEGSESDGQLRY